VHGNLFVLNNILIDTLLLGMVGFIIALKQ